MWSVLTLLSALTKHGDVVISKEFSGYEVNPAPFRQVLLKTSDYLKFESTPNTFTKAQSF